MEILLCKKCKKEKSITEFTLNKNSKTGYEPYCKSCRKEHLRIYHEKYHEKLKETRKKKYKTNVSFYCAKTKTYSDNLRENNPAKWRTRRFFERLKNIETDLTKEYIETLLLSVNKCQCCNKEMELKYSKKGERNNNSPSIDRIDSTKGYFKNNIGIICWKCNYRKTDLSLTDLQNLINYVQKM